METLPNRRDTKEDIQEQGNSSRDSSWNAGRHAIIKEKDTSLRGAILEVTSKWVRPPSDLSASWQRSQDLENAARDRLNGINRDSHPQQYYEAGQQYITASLQSLEAERRCFEAEQRGSQDRDEDARREFEAWRRGLENRQKDIQDFREELGEWQRNLMEQRYGHFRFNRTEIRSLPLQ